MKQIPLVRTDDLSLPSMGKCWWTSHSYICAVTNFGKAWSGSFSTQLYAFLQQHYSISILTRMATPVRHMQEPTVWQKLKMGALMGGGVGLTIGFIFGSYSILRSGAGPRGFLATLSQYMLSSAATFSFFLAIGSVIRNEGDVPLHLQPVSMQFASPLVRSRYEGAMRMRARWEAEKARQQS